jgi:hypothetical protein
MGEIFSNVTKAKYLQIQEYKNKPRSKKYKNSQWHNSQNFQK